MPAMASPEYMISKIELGRIASKSFTSALACPLYAVGEYIHSVEW